MQTSPDLQKKCSVLVSTCDKYEDAWFPFFELVKKFWSNCPFDFYLNTETKNYSHEGISLNVLNEIKQPDSQTEQSWGTRFINCLNRIQTPYVIVLLEDLFLQNNVDENEIERCLQRMESDKRIVCFNFKKVSGYDDLSPEYPNYFEMTKNIIYKINLQATLWNKNHLLSLLLPDDTPWSFEVFGYNRVKQDQLFYCSVHGDHSDMKNTVFPYLLDRDLGFGICRGFWLWNNDKLLKLQILLTHSG